MARTKQTRRFAATPPVPIPPPRWQVVGKLVCDFLVWFLEHLLYHTPWYLAQLTRRILFSPPSDRAKGPELTFPRFRHLPKEIRDEIWTAAIRELVCEYQGPDYVEERDSVVESMIVEDEQEDIIYLAPAPPGGDQHETEEEDEQQRIYQYQIKIWHRTPYLSPEWSGLWFACRESRDSVLRRYGPVNLTSTYPLFRKRALESSPVLREMKAVWVPGERVAEYSRNLSMVRREFNYFAFEFDYPGFGQPAVPTGRSPDEAVREVEGIIRELVNHPQLWDIPERSEIQPVFFRAGDVYSPKDEPPVGPVVSYGLSRPATGLVSESPADGLHFFHAYTWRQDPPPEFRHLSLGLIRQREERMRHKCAPSREMLDRPTVPYRAATGERPPGGGCGLHHCTASQPGGCGVCRERDRRVAEEARAYEEFLDGLRRAAGRG